MIALLVNPVSAGAAAEQRQLESLAGTVGAQILIVNAANVTDIDTAFAKVAKATSPSTRRFLSLLTRF